MISSTRKAPVEKKKRGRPRLDALDVMVALPRPLAAEIDEFRVNACDDDPSRPEAIRRLTLIGLARVKKGGLLGR